MENIKGILLDLDNTIGNRNKYSYRLYKDLLKKALPDMDPNSFEFEAIAQDLISWDETGNIKKDIVLDNLYKKYKIKIDVGKDITEWWTETLGKYFEVYPGAYETLDYLKKKYKLALITNGFSSGQNLKINTGKLRDYFDYIAISQEVGFAKPDPKIYQLALDELNIKANEAIFVGDTFSLDIKGAVSAGIKPIWINQEIKRVCDYPITTIRDINELKDIL